MSRPSMPALKAWRTVFKRWRHCLRLYTSKLMLKRIASGPVHTEYLDPAAESVHCSNGLPLAMAADLPGMPFPEPSDCPTSSSGWSTSLHTRLSGGNNFRE